MSFTSTSNQMGVPTFEDFTELQERFSQLAVEPDAELTPIGENEGAEFEITRLYADLDSPQSLLMVSLHGMVKVVDGGHRMEFKYQEVSENPDNGSMALVHDYEFQSRDGELTEFGHSISTETKEVDAEEDAANTSIDQTMADMGAQILRSCLDGELEPTSGDVAVLLGRMDKMIS